MEMFLLTTAIIAVMVFVERQHSLMQQRMKVRMRDDEARRRLK